MSGAAARLFVFSGKGADRVRLYWNQPTSQKRPADGGEQPTPPWAALAQASRKCTFAQLAEDTPVPYAACWRKNLRLYAAGRRKMWMRTRKNTISTSYCNTAVSAAVLSGQRVQADKTGISCTAY